MQSISLVLLLQRKSLASPLPENSSSPSMLPLRGTTPRRPAADLKRGGTFDMGTTLGLLPRRPGVDMTMKQHNWHRRGRQCRYGGGSKKGAKTEGDFPEDSAPKLINQHKVPGMRETGAGRTTRARKIP
jgi:hypothetical protein